jgi:hypothetical protein
MSACHGAVGTFTGIATVFFGFSWLYWLRGICADANKTLPEDKRLELGSWGQNVPRQAHWLWNEHGRLFPKSRKRIYAALCVILFFLIPIVALTACLLISGVAL